MTDTLNPTDFAIVYYGDGEPKICHGILGGTGKTVDGTNYAIYSTAKEACEQFMGWTTGPDKDYGIIPLRFLIEERPRYVLKESAKG